MSDNGFILDIHKKSSLSSSVYLDDRHLHIIKYSPPPRLSVRLRPFHAQSTGRISSLFSRLDRLIHEEGLVVLKMDLFYR